MAELFPKNDDKEHQDISEDVAIFFDQKQSNAEAHEILMITDEEQCQTCYYYATPGHTYPICRQAPPGASDEAKEQVLKNLMHCFNILTTSPSGRNP